MKNPFIEAGRITNTHGIRGEVKIEVWLDRPEDLCRYVRLFVDGQEKRIRSIRIQNRFALASFDGVNDINTAMPLKGKTVFIAREDAGLAPGEYFLQDLLQASVQDENGMEIGTLTDILERPANNVYVVTDRRGREILIPAVPAFIVRADAEAGILTVRLLEGM